MTPGSVWRQCPETVERIDAERRRRHELGLSTKVEAMDSAALFDEIGLFARVTITWDDGGEFVIDTREWTDVLRRMKAH